MCILQLQNVSRKAKIAEQPTSPWLEGKILINFISHQIKSYNTCVISSYKMTVERQRLLNSGSLLSQESILLKEDMERDSSCSTARGFTTVDRSNILIFFSFCKEKRPTQHRIKLQQKFQRSSTLSSSLILAHTCMYTLYIPPWLLMTVDCIYSILLPSTYNVQLTNSCLPEWST